LHDAEVDPTELEEVAVELDAAPDEDEPGDTFERKLMFDILPKHSFSFLRDDTECFTDLGNLNLSMVNRF
jgi:hypothetical protein